MKLQKLNKQQLIDLKQELTEVKITQSSKDRQIQILNDKLDIAKKQYERDANEKIQEAINKTEREKNLLNKQLDALSRRIEVNESERNELLDKVDSLTKETRCIPQLKQDNLDKDKCITDQQSKIDNFIKENNKLTEELKVAYDDSTATSLENSHNLTLNGQGSGRPSQADWQTIKRTKQVDQMMKELQAKLDKECDSKLVLQKDLQTLNEKCATQDLKIQNLHEEIEQKQAIITSKDVQLKEMQDQLEAKKLEIGQLMEFLAANGGFQQQIELANGQISQQQQQQQQQFLIQTQNDPTKAQGDHIPTNENVAAWINKYHHESYPQYPVENPNLDSTTYYNNNNPQPNQAPDGHEFKVKTFTNPRKCNHCCGLMFGSRRQGAICERCGFVAHVQCAKVAINICPIPAEALQRQNQFSLKENSGITFESSIKIPKPKGVKAGWVNMYMYLCDYRLHLFSVDSSDPDSIDTEVQQILDMRESVFRISDVTQNDVIHAKKSELPQIFRITVSLTKGPQSEFSMLFMASNKNKKQEWIRNATKLLDDLRQPEHPQNPDDCPLPIELHEAFDSSLPTPNLQRSVNCGMVYTTQEPNSPDSNKMIIGTEDGLYSIDTIKEEITQVSDSAKRQVYALTFMKNTNGSDVIAVISGRQKHVRLHQLPSLDGPDKEVIKIDETKGSMMITSGAAFTSRSRSEMVRIAENGGVESYELAKSQLTMAKKWALAVMLHKTKVFLYDISYRTIHKGDLGSYIDQNIEVKVINRISSEYPVTSMQILDGRLVLGHQASFCLYAIYDKEIFAPMALVQDTDKTLQFLKQETALCAVPIPRFADLDENSEQQLRMYGNQSSNLDNYESNITSISNSMPYDNEFLLCFRNSAVYVDANTGTRTRQNEINYPSTASDVAYGFWGLKVCFLDLFILSLDNSNVFFHLPSYNDRMNLVIIFTNRGIDLLQPRTSEWLQSIPLKSARPLNIYGRLIYSQNDTSMRLFYLKFNEKSNKIDLAWYNSSKAVTVKNNSNNNLNNSASLRDTSTDNDNDTNNSINPSQSVSQSHLPGESPLKILQQQPTLKNSTGTQQSTLQTSSNNNSSNNNNASAPRQLLINRIQMGTDEPELKLQPRQTFTRSSAKAPKKELKSIGRRKWKYSIPESERKAQLYNLLKDPTSRTTLISNPTDFNHVGHIGHNNSSMMDGNGSVLDTSRMIDIKQEQINREKSRSMERAPMQMGSSPVSAYHAGKPLISAEG